MALQALAAAVLGGPLLVTGALANDRAADFYFFRDTLHSLNVYGEFPWWNPSMWAGFPSYYINILYWPGREPLFAIMALLVWLLGRLQIMLPSYHALYVAYFALFVPLLLSLSVLALARQVLRHPLAVYFVIVLMAFSPGVVLSISDHGTEVSAYGFLWAAAWLQYLRRPSRRRFALLVLASATVMSALTFYALMWTVFFLPAFAVAVCIGRRGVTRQAVQAFRQIHPGWWAAAAAAMVICALPSLVAYSHGTEILSTRADGQRYYAYEALRPGTPLEALAVSTPAVGFEWTDYSDPAAQFEPRALSRTRQYISFGYMGMLTLPLVGLGLVGGRPYWAVRLWAGIAAVMTIAMLSAYSPIFSLVLGPPSPLRIVNHYSDVILRLGLFALLVLAAGLGVESLLRSRPAWRWTLVGLFAATATASAGWLVALQGAAAATQNFLFGLALAVALLYGIGLCRLALARTPAQIGAVVLALLPLVVVDTSAFAFAHLRLSVGRVALFPVEPGPDTIGSVTGYREADFLYLRGLRDEALVDQPGPAMTLTTSAGGEHPSAHEVAIVDRTYNGLIVRVRTAEAARLEWRDAYFAFWRAWINDTEASVERTSAGMKAVRVPAGESTVVFRFSPTMLRATVALSYLVMLASLVLWMLERNRSRARC